VNCFLFIIFSFWNANLTFQQLNAFIFASRPNHKVLFEICLQSHMDPLMMPLTNCNILWAKAITSRLADVSHWPAGQSLALCCKQSQDNTMSRYAMRTQCTHNAQYNYLTSLSLWCELYNSLTHCNHSLQIKQPLGLPTLCFKSPLITLICSMSLLIRQLYELHNCM